MTNYIINGHILYDFKGKFDIDFNDIIRKEECTLKHLAADIFDSTYGKESDKNNYLNQEFGFAKDAMEQKEMINTTHNNIKYALIRGYKRKTTKTIKKKNKEYKYDYDYGIITQVKKLLGLDLYTYLQDDRPHEEKLSCLRLLKILYAVEKYNPVSSDIKELPYANKSFISSLRTPSLDYILNPYSDKITKSNLDFLMQLIAEAYNQTYVDPHAIENIKSFDYNHHTKSKPTNLVHTNLKEKSHSSIVKMPDLTFENVLNMLDEYGISTKTIYDSNSLTKKKEKIAALEPEVYKNSSLTYHEIQKFWNDCINTLAFVIYREEDLSDIDFGVDLNSFNKFLDALQLATEVPHPKNCRNALEDFYWALQYFYMKCFSESCLTILETIKPILKANPILPKLSEEDRIDQFHSLELLTFVYKDNILLDKLHDMVTETINQHYVFNRLILNKMGQYDITELQTLDKVNDLLPDIYKSFCNNNAIDTVPFSLGTIVSLMQMIFLCQNSKVKYEPKTLYRKGHPRNLIDIISNIYKSDDSDHGWSGHLIIQIFTHLLYARNRLSSKDFEDVLVLTEKIFKTQSQLGSFGSFGEFFRMQHPYTLLNKYLSINVPKEAVNQFVTDYCK